MEPLIAVVVLALVIGFFGLMAWLVLRERRRAKERGELLLAQGFGRVPGAVPELEERVRALSPRGGRKWMQLSNIYTRQVPGGTVYLYDHQEGGGDDSDTRREVLGVLAPGLALPQFSLVALPEGLDQVNAQLKKSEVVGRILLRTVDWAVSKVGLERVEYPDDPEFARRYTVLAADPMALDAFLTPERRQALCALPRRLSLTARGDFFVLDEAPSSRAARPEPASPLERLAEANRVLGILS